MILISVQLLMILMSALLVGCRSETVQLRHPQTGVEVQCGPYEETGVTAQMAESKRERCIQDYQRQGYERVQQLGTFDEVVRCAA
jgi:hypothetical protein